MLNLLEREPVYGDFYVPAFSVKIGGKDLVRDQFLTVSNVEVDLKLKTAGRFSFTVANAFDLRRREFVAGADGRELDLLGLFKLGAKVEIRVGYGEPKKLPLLMLGLITELGTSFAEGGVPELKVAGFDQLYALANPTAPSTGRIGATATRSPMWRGTGAFAPTPSAPSRRSRGSTRARRPTSRFSKSSPSAIPRPSTCAATSSSSVPATRTAPS